MKNIIRYCFLILISGCASIVSKSDYPLTINSNIPESSVSITDRYGVQRYSGQAPATTILPASEGYFTRARYEIKVSKPGYGSSTSSLVSSIDPWYWGNIIFGGLIGLLIVDPLTGAMFELDPQVVNASLSSLSSSNIQSSAQNVDNKSIAKEVSNPGDLTKKLEEIKALKDKGLISTSDFEAQKAKILSNL